MMPLMQVRKGKVSYPTGDPSFAVMQAFPSGFNERESDPFLMCDHFGPTKSAGIERDPDVYPVGWHPHRGMDILTYMVQGKGRHADSMGNRGSFDSPGMQWISVGSGIEHAESGGTPKGEDMEGFQIWVNVPAARKMDDPRYGTVPPEDLPKLTPKAGANLRVLAGSVGETEGPFKTVAPVHIVEVDLDAYTSYDHSIEPVTLDNCIVYVYRGAGQIGGSDMSKHTVARFDASDAEARGINFTAGAEGLRAIIFAGKRLNEPIAWRGPMVMNTEAEVMRAYTEYRSGTFLRKRTPWDYKRLAAFPADHPARLEHEQCAASADK